MSLNATCAKRLACLPENRAKLVGCVEQSVECGTGRLGPGDWDRETGTKAPHSTRHTTDVALVHCASAGRTQAVGVLDAVSWSQRAGCGCSVGHACHGRVTRNCVRVMIVPRVTRNALLAVRPRLFAATSKTTQSTNKSHWSQVRQDDPLNLSISVSGGKENNNDSPSSGERSGNSSKLKSRRAAAANCSLWTAIEGGRRVKSAGKQRQRG